jgi:hypothetical protein
MAKFPFRLLPIVTVLACGCNDVGKITRLQDQLEAQQKEIHDLRAKLSGTSKIEALDLDEKCAKQAVSEFHAAGYKDGGFDSFTNHYDAALGKCFILVEATDTKTDKKGIWEFKHLWDAYERKSYGEFAFHVDPVKKYWQVKPFDCHVFMHSGEKKFCQSADEFDELVKIYMGGSGTNGEK